MAKIENESKIEYQEERIRSLVCENNAFCKTIRTMEEKLIKAQETIEARNLELKEIEQKLTQLKLNHDSEKAILNGL